MLIATHDGTFHADETTACAIITYLYENSNIIRSRDPDELEKADIIIDVSGINDDRHYDHHCKDFKDSRKNGIRYATAGLMWKKYGIEFLRKVVASELSFHPNAETLEKAFERVDNEVMVMIDLNDNGDLTKYVDSIAPQENEGEKRVAATLNDFYQNDPSIPYIVAMANTPSASPQIQDKNFLNTVKMLRTILVNCAINALHTETGIAKVLEAYKGGPMLVIHERLPWTSAIFANMDTFKDCLIAVYPDRNQRWRIQSLPVSKAQRFVNRLSAPEQWRGLNDKDLDAATGLHNMNFIHRSGFTGGASDYDSCMELARLWLEKGVKP